MRNLNWHIFFVFCCWFIWKWRCKKIIEPNFCFPYKISEVISSYASEWYNATCKSQTPRSYQTSLVSWCRPDPGVFRLNVDGSRSNGGLIGAGGIIHDSSGN